MDVDIWVMERGFDSILVNNLICLWSLFYYNLLGFNWFNRGIVISEWVDEVYFGYVDVGEVYKIVVFGVGLGYFCSCEVKVFLVVEFFMCVIGSVFCDVEVLWFDVFGYGSLLDVVVIFFLIFDSKVVG